MRHTNGVVEVALRGQCGIARVRGQDACHHLRHGGLAIAAGHCHQRQSELRTPAGRQRAECAQGVGHLDAGQARRRQTALRQCGRGTGRARLRQKSVGVKALALQRDKQIARLQAAAVGVNARQRSAACAQQARLGFARSDPAVRLLQRHQGRGRAGLGLQCGVFFNKEGHSAAPCALASRASAVARACNAMRACSMSENGRRSPAVSW